MPAGSRPADWVEADVQYRDPCEQADEPQLQLLGPPAQSTFVQQAANQEHAPGNQVPQQPQSQHAQQLLQLPWHTQQRPHSKQAQQGQQVPLQMPLSQHAQQAQQLAQEAQLPPLRAQQRHTQTAQLQMRPQQLLATAQRIQTSQQLQQPTQMVMNDDFGFSHEDIAAQAAANPLAAPFTGLIKSPLNSMLPPPALQDIRGNWSYLHKPGIGTMAVAPPSASPTKKLAAAHASLRLQQGSSALMVHQGLPVYTANNANPAADGVAQSLAGHFNAVQLRKRPFPELKTFQSIVQLHKIAKHGDDMKGTPSFAEMQQADPGWRKNFRQRYHEFNGILQEISLQAAKHQKSEDRIAADMDHTRQQQKQQVATFVKEIGKMRAQRKRGD